MPGICGKLSAHVDPNASEILSRMLRPLQVFDWHQVNRFNDDSARVSLGHVGLGFVNQSKGVESSLDGRYVAVLDGELYDTELLTAELKRQGIELDAKNHTSLLLAGYGESNTAFLRRLNGSFAAAIWDARERQLILVNDRFGTRPLYYAVNDQGVVFSSSIRSVMAEGSVSSAPCVRGLAQFFSFGHYLLNDTSLEAVRVLPPAACFSFDANNLQCDEKQYAQLGMREGSAKLNGHDHLEQIDNAFFEAVQRRVNGTKNLGISLSGGLDARSILAVIDHKSVPVKTICMGQKGSLDLKSSKQLAGEVGCEHHDFILGTGFLSNFRQHLNDMVRLTDGQYLSQCIVMPTLPAYQQLGIQVLLRGHAGELMHMHKAYSYSLDQQAMSIGTEQQLEDWLFSRLQGYLLAGVERPLFCPAINDSMAELARASLRTHIAEFRSIDPPLQRIWPLFVQQRIRRETALSMAKFRSIVEPRLPFLDNDLVDLLFEAHPSLKTSEAIQTFILKKRRPSFLAVSNANTGTRVGASRLMQSASTFKMRVLAKLGVPGYQPYERLGLWLRQELAPTVRDVLLDDVTLSNGTFNADGIRQVVSDHLDNRKNHTYLLMALMTFELGRRLLAN